MERKKILVVDDEETICEALKFNLEQKGYDVDVAHSGEDALALSPENYSLILLDVMMEGVSGLQVARILRRNPKTERVPIIFCSARDTDDDVVEGLATGADDYITKPYSIKTLLARVEAVLRRSSHAPASEKPGENRAGSTVSYEGLVLMPDSKRCFVDGEEVRMPRKEFGILLTLLSRPGHVFSREELLELVWPSEVVVLNRVVDVNVTRIRQKIGAYGKNLVTRSGYGYVFEQ